MKILQITSELDGGGIERLLYDYCMRMPEDICFDFAVCDHEKVGILEQPLTERGCNIYRYLRLHDGLLKSVRSIKKIISDGKYDIVHVQAAYKSFPALYAAWRCGVKVRIAHSHIAYAPETKPQYVVRKISTVLTKLFATTLFACGRDAGRWAWGKKADFYIMRNGIDVKSFCFSEEKRQELRKKYGLEDKLVIGNVARFSFQKNHEFLLEVFAELVKSRQDAVLVLIGRGELEAQVKAKVQQLELNDKVLFLGVRKDVPDLLNMMDVFLLPSRFEGLPVSLVEVQANGLPAVVADSITDEIKIASNVQYVSLSAPLEAWTSAICSLSRHKEKTTFKEIRDAGYDIDIEANKLAMTYSMVLNVGGKNGKW